jgi:hypothetical protein
MIVCGEVRISYALLLPLIVENIYHVVQRNGKALLADLAFFSSRFSFDPTN